MPTAGHMPRPWPKDYVHEAVRHIARNCDFIKSRSDPDFPGWDRYNGDSDLIAAAPKMLTMLIALSACVDSTDRMGLSVIRLSRSTVEALDNLIAEAQGRQS